MMILIFVAVLVLDQVSKILVAANQTNTDVLGKLVRFIYVENRGAAFAFLDGKEWAPTFFIIVSALIMLLFFFIYVKYGSRHKVFKLSLLLILTGAVGNFIDRIAFGYVRDFISISFFPAIFNVADAAITIGGALFVIYFLFLDEEAIIKHRKKNDDSNSGTPE